MNALLITLLLGLIAGVFWIFFRMFLPVQALRRMADRVARGERVRAWPIVGPLPVRRIAESLEKISDRMHSLEETNESTARELEVLISGVDEGIVLVDKNGWVKFSNATFRRLFAVRDEEEGRRLLDLVQVFEVNEVVSQSLRTGEVESDGMSFHSYSDDQMRLRSYRLVAHPLKDAGGRVSGSLLIVTDYSKLKEMEAHERDMIAGVSHELRTPLAVFKGYLEALIEMEKKGRQETRRILDVLARHSNRLNQLVEDLLTLSRVEEKALEPMWEPVSISNFLNRVCEDARHFLKTDVEIKICVEPGIKTIEMDVFRMEQVFHNLIDNAQRHSEDSQKIYLGVQRDRDSKTYHFSVRDEGVGIPSDKLPMIFDRFYRVDRARSRARGGTGLGLTIVREIVRSHGGDAWAQSNLGEGTTIWFSLPQR